MALPQSKNASPSFAKLLMNGKNPKVAESMADKKKSNWTLPKVDIKGPAQVAHLKSIENPNLKKSRTNNTGSEQAMLCINMLKPS